MSRDDARPAVEAIVASAIPGRVRLTLPRAGGERLRRLAEALAERPEVIEVRPSPRAQALVVRFDESIVDIGALVPALRDLGIHVRLASAGPPRHGSAPAKRQVHDAAEALERAVTRRLTGADRRVVIPLALAVLSARQAVRGAPGLREAPWYVLAWYAFETFRALDPAGARRTATGPKRATTEEA